jgi:SAM-dependent methyltransferase
MEMISRACPLCGSSDTSRIFAKANYELDRLDSFAFASRKMPEYMHYQLVECPCCDLIYANPLPHEDFLAEVYSEAAYDSGVEAHFAATTYATLLPYVVERLPDRHGALDIGAGDGAFLEKLLHHGFDEVVGVEPSRAPIAAASENVRPLLREGIFRGDDFAPGSLSLVTCFQTLEHLSKPQEMTSVVWKLLKPGGAAYFICHNRRAFSVRLLGRKSPVFDIEHLQLFSPRSARYLLEQAGFKDVLVIPIVNRYPLRYWLKLLPLTRKFKETLIAVLDLPGFGNMVVPMPAGNLAVVGYKASN